MVAPNKTQSRAVQRGFVAVLLIVMMALAGMAALTAAMWGSGDPVAYQKKITRQALQQAKEALLAHVELSDATGYNSALSGNTAVAAAGAPAAARLACTDLNGDGNETSSCSTGAGAPASAVHSLGLFPWRTVGVPTQRDASDECLWYAVSGSFKNLPPTLFINADSNGQFSVIQPVKSINTSTGVVTWSERLLVGDTSPTAVSGNRAVAVIIAPGSASRAQNRTPLASSRECPLPLALSGTPNAETSAPRFLDAYTGTISANNALLPLPATASKVWVQADEGHEKLNDELIWITADEFANAVTKRAIRIYKTAIEGYVHGYFDEVTNVYIAGNGFYPSAASAPGGACVPGRLQGYVPFTCAGVSLNIGAQLTDDGWNTQTHYAVSENCISPAPIGQMLNTPPFSPANLPTNVCGVGARIAVGSDTSTVQALLLLRGRPRTGQPPCATFATMFNCIENPANQTAVALGNALTAPFPPTLAPNTYMPIATESNDSLYLFRQRIR